MCEERPERRLPEFRLNATFKLRNELNCFLIGLGQIEMGHGEIRGLMPVCNALYDYSRI